jgi:pimeloyl-ACP methyl ester carboxylesterase
LRILRRIAISGILIGVFVYVGLSILVAHVLTQPINRANSFNPAILPNIVPWSTTTADGLTIRGWYCPTPKPRRLIVLVHGMGGSLDEMTGIGLGLHASGFDVLFFDLRGHGSSDPARLTMGANERGDIRAVLDWAETKGFSPDRIGWLGWSMGASTLLMEAEDNPKIRALVIDSAFGDLPELLNRQLAQHSHLPSFFNPGILFAAEQIYGVRTDNLIPIRSAAKWGDRPILVIHGEGDSVVPVVQARAIVKALGSTAETMIVPEIDHVGAFKDNPKLYLTRVSKFFDKNLTP